MSHTERQDVTYYSGHVIEVNGRRYAPERTCSIEPDPDDPDIEKPWYRCRSCGYARSICDWLEWDFCPKCGSKRTEEDKCR